MSEPTPTPAEQQDAYALLSKPTKNLSDAEVKLIIADLRKRRFTSLATGKPDKPVKEAKERKKPTKATDDEKRRNTELLLAQLKIG